MIFTGNGKGKTTAALGQGLRAVGRGKRVLMIQFIKGPWESGEDISVQRLYPEFKISKKGLGFVGIKGDNIPREEHIAAAKYALDSAVKDAKQKKCDIIILDEVWNALSLGLITTEAVDTAIEKMKSSVEHIIMTGRDCPQSFIDKADIATEMHELRHVFTEGKAGVSGLEF